VLARSLVGALFNMQRIAPIQNRNAQGD